MKKNYAFAEMIKNNIGILAGLLILCVGLSLLTDKFATTTNFFNIVKQITINLYLACGMTFVILLGGIDLSVGSVIAVAGCVSAGMATWNGLPVPAAILIGILCGMVIACVNGLIVSRTTIPAFITTLATMNIGRGIARVYTNNQTISVLQPAYTFLGTGKILNIPVQLFMIIIIIALCSFILNRTRLGKHIYAVGGNKTAAEYSGIHTKKSYLFCVRLFGPAGGNRRNSDLWQNLFRNDSDGAERRDGRNRRSCTRWDFHERRKRQDLRYGDRRAHHRCTEQWHEPFGNRFFLAVYRTGYCDSDRGLYRFHQKRRIPWIFKEDRKEGGII